MKSFCLVYKEDWIKTRFASSIILSLCVIGYIFIIFSVPNHNKGTESFLLRLFCIVIAVTIILVLFINAFYCKKFLIKAYDNFLLVRTLFYKKQHLYIEITNVEFSYGVVKVAYARYKKIVKTYIYFNEKKLLIKSDMHNYDKFMDLLVEKGCIKYRLKE